ncbi:T9SS type A sorting domain-containing protein [Polaribacter sp. M15]|jgi:hypothetical protein
MKKNYFIKELSILFLSLFISATSYAQLGTDTYTLGLDNANNYGGTWNETSAGTGFGDWVFDTYAGDGGGGFAGRFTGSFSAALDVSSTSFGLFANSQNNTTSGATRSLPQNLQEGDVFKISVGVNFRDGAKGFDLRDASNSTIVNFNVGSDKYTIAGIDLFSNAYDANTVITFTFTQNATSLDWTADRTGGLTGTQSGTINSINAGTITNLRLYNVSSGTNGDGGSGERNLYFNSFEFTSLYSINANSSVTVSSNTTAPYLTIESGSSVTVSSNIDLNISGNLSNSGTLTANAGSSLRIGGTSTGNVTYNRTLNFVSGNTNGWHLVSSPVAGEIFDNTFATNNDIASGSSTNLGVASYNTTGNTWTYLQSPSGSISSTSGMGYSVKRASTGTVSFTGTINTGDVNGVTVGTADGGFNLLGNPYTAYMSSQTFLNANTNTTGQIWTWTDGGGYTARTAADNFIIAPGQGFFVSVASGSTVDFAESNQTSGTDNFQKTNKTEISLFIANGKVNRSARLMYFDDNVTKGFDWGYEGKTFTGVKTNMEVFTHILENNIGENYQVQSLPKKDMESMVIPVGITADAGKITFTAKAMNLPNGLKVFLEDRENNTFTRLDETNASYAVTLTEKTDGVGRFYLHTKSSSVLSTDAFTLNTISMYPTNSNNLRIVGLSQGKSQIKLFTILGKQVVNKSFTANGVYNVQLPNLTTGVYIAQLENESGQISKKIVLE